MKRPKTFWNFKMLECEFLPFYEHHEIILPRYPPMHRGKFLLHVIYHIMNTINTINWINTIVLGKSFFLFVCTSINFFDGSRSILIFSCVCCKNTYNICKVHSCILECFESTILARTFYFASFAKYLTMFWASFLAITKLLQSTISNKV